MEINETKIINLSQGEITQILICELQERGIIKKNVSTSDIYIREEDGEVKCTIKA